jgi:hypothetical protein
MGLNQVLIDAAKDRNMLVLKTALEKGAMKIEIDPKYAEAYCNRGLVYGEKKLTISACDDFYQAGILYLKQNNKTQPLKCVNLMKKIDFSSPLIDKLQDLIDQI